MINNDLEDCCHQVTGRANLEGALESVFATFGGQDLYPSLIAKAAALLEKVALIHGFFDGNKRTAWYAFVTFLDLNGINLCEESTGYQDDLVVNLVEKKISRDDVERWVEDNLVEPRKK
ncbi:type II toxin-antitoxin system death-on-curing family toxin [Corynebacterium sp. P5848]|uniref:type II toxin-antitoxin system death-on-curing family toxin n=1 Tax=Corynebacterium marambiense TaxID=2765364 RepID=UPI002260C3F8|nr:type II toxin-antitoxin system death-on-curing family toxin [Corynebacterium marambiense]MCX7542178.1 type II toxin-antitoxin system death-on-curing family toxin [Corynebacterium marambiense]